MKYRAELDGLRAIAVLPVIFFHAGFDWFKGGFVGVDVFFVISGYLITTIIVGELETGDFRLSRFYERRARRILPALIFVVFFSIPIAWFALTPIQMFSFSQSLVGVGLFVSNIVFMMQSGYFDTSAELKPLLHTWSLAVEEQYYVLFPLLMLVISRWGRTAVVVSLFGLCAASLFLAQLMIYESPSIAFFSIQTRAWEILLGALCAIFLLQRRGSTINKLKNNPLAIFGLLLILVPVFLFDRSTPTPSLFTLIPVLGTVLVIVFARAENGVGALLGCSALTGVGLVSYSAYLWHQPIFSFYRNAFPNSENQLIYLPLIALVMLFAVLSWRYVEQPFRRAKGLAGRKLAAILIPIMALIFSLGLWGHVEKGFRYDMNPQSIKSEVKTNANVVVIGDSHADHLRSGLQAQTNGFVQILGRSDCVPLLGVERINARRKKGECATVMSDAYRAVLSDETLTNLIISAMGPVYIQGIPFRGKDEKRLLGHSLSLVTNQSVSDHWEVFEIGLRNTFAILDEQQGKKIIFALDIPELGIDNGCNPGAKRIEVGPIVLHTISGEVPSTDCRIPKTEYIQRNNRYRSLVKAVASEFANITVFDPERLFCDDDWCYGYLPTVGYLYKNVDHLNAVGSNYLASALIDELL